jgi:hypothetical protein
MIVLIMAVFVFNNSKNSTEIDKGIFQIANLEKIDHIVLQSAKEKIDLKFNGTKWLVNNTHEADRQMITVLFAALKQVEAKRLVASTIQDSVKNEINKNGIKISCLEGEVLSKEFWSEGNQQKSETYFQLSDGIPYLVTIPGYRVYVASVFEVPTSEWRDKQVFNFNWQNIKSLEVNFPSDAKQSFKASFIGRLFSIENIATDTTKLDKFMDALFQLRAEKILDSVDVKNYQSALSQTPLMEIKIYDIGNQSYPLTIFPIEKGSDVIVGKVNEVVLLNPMAIRGIFRKKNFFVQQ